METKGGGVILPYSNEKDNILHSREIFNYYLENAETIQLLSSGLYGYAFLLKLPDALNDKNKLYKNISH